MRMLAVRDSNSDAIKSVARSFYGTDVQRLIALDRWERRYYRFRDENEEIIRAPLFMLQDLEQFGYLEGDCDDISTLTASIILNMDLPCRFVSIRTDPLRNDYLHVFVEAQISSGEWIRMDATVSTQTVMTYYGERMIEYVH